LVDLEAAINHVASERNQTTHPHSLPLGSGDLFAGYLTFELGEGQQDVKRPINVVVLNCRVTATKETPRSGNRGRIGQPTDYQRSPFMP
jgi:hypothetical protein